MMCSEVHHSDEVCLHSRAAVKEFDLSCHHAVYLVNMGSPI